jgi:HEAT repeat protein
VALKSRKSVGVFTTDRALVVQSWDPWIAEATGIPESAAVGQALSRLYPDLGSRGLLARLRRVADGAGVEVLAPAFHKYLLPCVPRDPSSRFERMRQHVTIAPVRSGDVVEGIVVTIEDVTERFDRDRQLTADLDSADEGVRLRAAQRLAESRESPNLLANALTDESWRVRRIAAAGMAEVGGRDVVDTLIEAIREHHRDPALLNAALTALTRTREDVVMSIVALLDLDDADVRTYAVLALGLVGDVRAVPALVARLDDADMNVRFHSIEALGRLGDRSVADAIAAIAESRDFFLSFAALDALAAIGEPAVAPRLVPLLEDELLRPAAAACLGALGAEDVAIPLASLIERSSFNPAPIAVALANVFDRLADQFGEGALISDLAKSVLTPAAAKALIDATPRAGDEELRGIATVLSWMPYEGITDALAGFLRTPAARNVAAQALARRGGSAAPVVEAMIADADAEVRKAAGFILGRIGSRTSVGPLVDAMRRETESEVLVAIVTALGAIGDDRAFAPLLELLDHSESAARQAVVSAINSIGHSQMEPAISARLKFESPRVREAAARIAGYFGYASCLRQMVELCDDPETIVRRSAVESLANYDQRPAWSKILESVSGDGDPTVRAAAARALARSQSDESLTALVAATRDANLWVRYFAVRSLASRRSVHADVLAALAEFATRDRAIPVRIAAIEALGAIGAPAMLPVITLLTQDHETEVATGAIAALGDFSPSATRGALLQSLGGADNQRQRAALDAAARHGAQNDIAIVDAVAAIAQDTRDDDLRRHAIRTLGAIGNRFAVDALVALGGNGKLTAFVIGVLAELDETRASFLRETLANGTDRERQLAVDALARMRHGGAGPILAIALTDVSPVIRLAAARAIGRLDLHDARAQLAALSRTDENPAVRIAAGDALARG